MKLTLSYNKYNTSPQWNPLGAFCFNTLALVIKPIFLILLGIGSFTYSYAQPKLILTESLSDAYRDISALRINEGKQKLINSGFLEDQNMMGYYIENYIDFFTLFIQENQNEYKRLLPNRNLRLQKIKSADSNSPYYLFCQAEIILQWAIIKLKFNDKISAAKDVYEAYNLLVENQKRFPDFQFNKKSLSIIHALAENIPSWFRKLMGIHGSISLGTKEIESLAKYTSDHNHIFKNEVIAIYSYILFYSNNKKEAAFQLFDTYKLDHRYNPLIAFLKSTMAQKTGKNDLAIKILEERPSTKAYLHFDYLDFLYGKFKLYRLDSDADEYLLHFVNNFKGRHYIKEAYQKLAWYNLIIHRDQKKYERYLDLCRKLGTTLIDEDKQAFKEAKQNEVPDITLLKSRLLFDGGYYQNANDLLASHSLAYVNTNTEGEYYYRMARIKDALNDSTQSLKFYKLAINKSKPDKYFACSSALNAGLIYEKKHLYEDAASYYQKCLQLNPEGYGVSLHQKAKSGLERVKGK